MSRPLYELDCELLTPNAFHAKFSELTGPTSLFENLKNRDVNHAFYGGHVESKEPIQRPITPIEESITAPISSVGELCQLLQKRINARLVPLPGLSSKQQQMLIGVIFSELKSCWADVKKLAPVPFLDNHQNAEIERLVAIEVVTICEELYFKTLKQVKALNDKGVFSTYANTSRLKAQLALEANKSLDIIKIHKSLAATLREESAPNSRLSTASGLSRFTSAQTTSTNVKKPVRRARYVGAKKLTREEKDKKQRDQDMTEIQTQVPDISLKHVEKKFGILNYDLYKSSSSSVEKKEEVTTTNDEPEKVDYTAGTPLPAIKRPYQSLPNIMVGESLPDELGLTNEERIGYRRKSVDTLGVNLMRSALAFSNGDDIERVRQDGSNFISEDLKKLATTQELDKETTVDDDEDLSPLLQGLSYSNKRKKYVASSKLRKASEVCSTVASSIACNEDLEERERDSMLDNSTEVKQPVQLATVSTRMPDKSVVRTSDVRVSRRINKSGAILNTFPTVYNDLTGEIDSVAVKWLDRNLFIGDEVREVYDEIIKTVGKDHLLYDQDPHVVKHATEAHFSAVVHSGLLTGNKSDRVINETLRRDAPPPWGTNSAEKWRNSPMFGELGRQDILNIGAQGMADLPGKATKSYNSWLAWWRSTITTDDYFKFLSTQDNDYLSLTYHLYESDDGGSDDDADKEYRPNARELRIQKAKEEKLVEIRKLKENYEAGYWNANSVLIGGLGKYPEITGEELGIDESESSAKQTKEQGYEFDEGASPLSLQGRLDNVWSLLCTPDALRLDMAIKYSSEIYFDKLEEMILQWESVVKLILSRENLITKLEDFERQASDPNRFFERGSTGSAGARIKETKIRRQLHHNLDKIEEDVKKCVTIIQTSYGDVVTYQGRPYLDKMASDRTEMLYWLQQERRENALDMIAKRTVELKISEIPPLPVDHVL